MSMPALLSTCFTSLFIVLGTHSLLSTTRLVVEAAAAVEYCSPAMSYPAIFSFGTSLSDTGNGILSNPLFFPSTRPPYGETFFRHPTGRFSNGRLIIDLLAEGLGLPFLNPYLNKSAVGTDFSNGVNYAVAGATVQRTGYLLRQGDISFLTTDSLDVQINWHLSIKQAAAGTQTSNPPAPGVILPAQGSFSKALYFLEFGGNDYGTSLLSRHILPIQNKQPISSSYILNNVVPVVINKLVEGIELLYANEARNFLVLNIFPEGCAPLFLKLLVGSKDSKGCLEAFNEIDNAHNQLLLSALGNLRAKYPDINLIYADGAKVYDQVLQNPSKYGFSEDILACCGAGPQVPLQFALSKICGPSSYNCPDPSKYVIWDGIHNTETMYNLVTKSIFSGEILIPSDGLKCG